MRFASVILDIPTQALDAPYTYSVPEAAGRGRRLRRGGGVRRARAVRARGRRWGSSWGIAGASRRRGAGRYRRGEGQARRARREPRRTSTRRGRRARSGSRSATWRRCRRACACSRRRAACRAWCARRRGYWRLEEPAVGEVDDRWVVPGEAFDGFEPRKNAVKQASIVAALRAGELRVAELAAEFGAVSARAQGARKAGRRAHRAPPAHAGLPSSDGLSAAGTSRRCGRPRHPISWGCRRLAYRSTLRLRHPRRPRAPRPPSLTYYANLRVRFNLRHCFVPSPKPPLTPGQAAALARHRRGAARAAGARWCSWTASPARARPRCTCRPSRRRSRAGRTALRARARDLAYAADRRALPRPLRRHWSPSCTRA